MDDLWRRWQRTAALWQEKPTREGEHPRCSRTVSQGRQRRRGIEAAAASEQDASTIWFMSGAEELK